MKGYIYALINPSLKGLVKVGKTTRNPEERAIELSSATGVPTPFIVGYEIFVDDCDAAESFVHELLGIKGLRLSKNREFFQASLAEVVSAIVDCKDIYGVDVNNHFEDESSQSTEDVNSLVNTLLEEAKKYHYGSDGYFEDHHEAEKIYLQAITLGSFSAAIGLADMYWSSSDLHSPKKAIKYANIALEGLKNFILQPHDFLFEIKKIKDDDKSLSEFIELFDYYWFESYMQPYIDTLNSIVAFYSLDGHKKNASIALTKIFEFYELPIKILVSGFKKCEKFFFGGKILEEQVSFRFQNEYWELLDVPEKNRLDIKSLSAIPPVEFPYNGYYYGCLIDEFRSFFYFYMKDIAVGERPVSIDVNVSQNIDIISKYIIWFYFDYLNESSDDRALFSKGVNIYKMAMRL